MDLSGSDWLIVILLLVGVVVLLYGLRGRMQWTVVLIGAALTAVAVVLIVIEVSEPEIPREPAPSASPGPELASPAPPSPERAAPPASPPAPTGPPTS